MGKGKNKKNKQAASTLPTAPWIFINDAVDRLAVSSALASLMPKACIHTDDNLRAITSASYKDVVCILPHSYPAKCLDVKQRVVDKYHAAAVVHGRNFVSVNCIYGSHGKSTQDCSANHLELLASGLTAPQIAEAIFKWLFKVLTVPETVHLISDKEMRAIDTKTFPDYAYCPISESRSCPKDAKIQFVALVTSKPQVMADRQLAWQVADKTGVANFYFQWRGPESKYTWDWVLKLQPGERKALPRMPMVQIKEEKSKAIIKAPFRAVGFVVGGTGTFVKAIGDGMFSIGKKVTMGKHSEWVHEADTYMSNGKLVKIDRGKDRVYTSGCTQIKIFDQKGRKAWKDDDSVASTTAGSILDEKEGKELS